MEFMQELFSPIVSLFSIMLDFFYHLTTIAGIENYGIAIILMTIFIKCCLYPLTAKQLRSMKAMQELQPKMKKIQDNYKNNPQLMQQKIAELYKDSGVNPLAGCLPLFIQMPILMGVYYSLYDLEYIGDPGFMWLPNLSKPDPIYALPVLSALTTYLMQKQSSAQNEGGANQQMKIMMMVMPIFIGWISLSFPSGLVLYWVTMNVVQIAQQYYMFNYVDKN